LLVTYGVVSQTAILFGRENSIMRRNRITMMGAVLLAGAAAMWA
jgi:hypothetical protein